MFLGPPGCDECEGVGVPDQTFSLGPAAQALSSDHSLSLPPEWPAAPGPAKHYSSENWNKTRAGASAACNLGACVHRCGQIGAAGRQWEPAGLTPRHDGREAGISILDRR